MLFFDEHHICVQTRHEVIIRFFVGSPGTEVKEQSCWSINIFGRVSRVACFGHETKSRGKEVCSISLLDPLKQATIIKLSKLSETFVNICLKIQCDRWIIINWLFTSLVTIISDQHQCRFARLQAAE